MATSFEAQAVKSLNKSPGRRRFVFKKFSQRVEEIDIGVFRSLDPLKLEPAEGSSFFRDCLVQWRELNTAEDFISFYEEMTPLVQTLPQIILQKELILSELLSRLKMKGRLSLEPILRLIAVLSRDLLEDFLPFLQRIADSLVLLLNSGADKEPEIIEQIFTSWSCIMMYLQKYLVKDIVHVLKVTVKLRYYPKDYVQEFMAESVSFLLRNAPVQELIKASVHSRKAVLGFLSQLEVDELPLFYALLIEPLGSISQGVDAVSNWFWGSPQSSEESFDSFGILRHFTMDNIKALSWKKRYGFLHVIEDILGVFDEFHIVPFLDLLMGCVVRILASCTSSLDSVRSSVSSLVENSYSLELPTDKEDSAEKNKILTTMDIRQFKDLRSLCLKIFSFVLGKYEDHNFGNEFWDLFFTSVKPLIDGFKQEGASSEKPSSLLSCFLAMSGSYKLVPLLYREKNLVPDIFSILMVNKASDAIVSYGQYSIRF